jgi:hypothetical protein
MPDGKQIGEPDEWVDARVPRISSLAAHTRQTSELRHVNMSHAVQANERTRGDNRARAIRK